MDGRLTSAYISSNCGDRPANAPSASALIIRSGRSSGIAAPDRQTPAYYLRVLPSAHSHHLTQRWLNCSPTSTSTEELERPKCALFQYPVKQWEECRAFGESSGEDFEF